MTSCQREIIEYASNASSNVTVYRCLTGHVTVSTNMPSSSRLASAALTDVIVISHASATDCALISQVIYYKMKNAFTIQVSDDVPMYMIVDGCIGSIITSEHFK